MKSIFYRTALGAGAVLCIAVLLVSTFAQALDCCEFAQLRTSQQVSADQSASSGPAICLICAAAHAASLPSLISSPLAALRIGALMGAPIDAFPRVMQIFALHVRPPPSL